MLLSCKPTKLTPPWFIGWSPTINSAGFWVCLPTDAENKVCVKYWEVQVEIQLRLHRCHQYSRLSTSAALAEMRSYTFKSYFHNSRGKEWLRNTNHCKIIPLISVFCFCVFCKWLYEKQKWTEYTRLLIFSVKSINWAITRCLKLPTSPFLIAAIDCKHKCLKHSVKQQILPYTKIYILVLLLWIY